MTIQVYSLPVKQSWINTCRGRLTKLKCVFMSERKHSLLHEQFSFWGIFPLIQSFLVALSCLCRLLVCCIVIRGLQLHPRPMCLTDWMQAGFRPIFKCTWIYYYCFISGERFADLVWFTNSIWWDLHCFKLGSHWKSLFAVVSRPSTHAVLSQKD